ncbi:MAG: nitronate monooxygenase family protein [Acidobacteriota bacterium]
MPRPTLKTPICELFEIDYPIVLAGMGGVISPSGPALAAAVSNAGGLGVLGGAFLTPEQLADAIRTTRSLTDRPFGVDTLLPMNVVEGPQKAVIEAVGAGRLTLDDLIPPTHRDFASAFTERHDLPEPPSQPPPLDPKFIEKQIEVVFDLRPPVYVAGLGDPGFMVERAHQLGIRVGSVVGATRHARRVLASGVDFVVAQGHDGGGHNSRIGTMALIPQVVDAVAPIPVLGAGSIMDGRGLVAALALGAQGVWCGSLFLATEEADITPEQKQAIVANDEDSTIISRCMTGKPARFFKNVWEEEFRASGLDPLPMPLQAYLAHGPLAAAEAAGRADISPGAAGQGVGMVDAIRPAAEVFERLVEQSVAVLTGDLATAVDVA